MSHKGRPPKPCELKPLEDIDLMWVVGLLEGEGSFYVASHGGQLRPKVVCNMTDEDVISRLHITTGIGSVSVYKYKRPNCKDAYHWQVAAVQDVLALCKLVRPHMGKRRQGQIDNVLSRLKELGHE